MAKAKPVQSQRQASRLRRSQAPPLPWRRQGSADVHPEVAISALRKVRAPNELLCMCSQLWNSQQRWLCFHDQCLPEPVTVQTSLPQGDALSPLCLVAIMTFLSKAVEQQLEAASQNITQVTYLDDRTVVAPNPTIAFQCVDAWASLSARVGFQENQSKLKVCPATNVSQAALQSAGFSQQQVVTSFAGPWCRLHSKCQKCRTSCGHQPH